MRSCHSYTTPRFPLLDRMVDSLIHSVARAANPELHLACSQLANDPGSRHSSLSKALVFREGGERPFSVMEESVSWFFLPLLFLPSLAWWNVHARGCEIYRSRLLSLSTWWNKPFCGLAFFNSTEFLFPSPLFGFCGFFFFSFSTRDASSFGILFLLIDFKFSFSSISRISFFFSL